MAALCKRHARIKFHGDLHRQVCSVPNLLATKWYVYAKWVLERVEGFPKSQRFILSASGFPITP